MNRRQLEHAIRAACRILGVDEVIVVGSQAILGQHPRAPAELLVSAEVDIWAEGLDQLHIDKLNAIGIDSHFHRTHGFYVDPVGPETATLPGTWRQRAIRVAVPGEAFVGWCPEAADLAISKLARGEAKDTDFVAGLLVHALTTESLLLARRAELGELAPAAAQPLDQALRVAVAKAARRRRRRSG